MARVYIEIGGLLRPLRLPIQDVQYPVSLKKRMKHCGKCRSCPHPQTTLVYGPPRRQREIVLRDAIWRQVQLARPERAPAGGVQLDLLEAGSEPGRLPPGPDPAPTRPGPGSDPALPPAPDPAFRGGSQEALCS